MEVTNHKKLIVWKKSIDFVTELYKLTQNFPNEEKFGIISQMRRASISIPSNIAEGAGRKGSQEFKQFLFIAKGSCYEIDTQLTISQNLGYISEDEKEKFCDIVQEISKMLQGLINIKS